MFISNLIHTLESYDKYGEHRLNGMKILYILFILFAVNMFTDIYHIYFYYFYVPLSAMAVEVMFEHFEEKISGFTFTLVGSSLMIFIFNLFRPYPILFLIIAFTSCLGLYVLVLLKRRLFIPSVPIILGLAAYSSLYPSYNMNLNMLFNNFITTSCAWLVIVAALILFPRSYYYRLWLRAFILLLQEILAHLQTIEVNDIRKLAVTEGHTKHMVAFSHMISRQLPVYTILKINLLAHQLHIESCVSVSRFKKMNLAELTEFNMTMRAFIQAVKSGESYPMTKVRDLKLRKIVQSWNLLCSKI